MKRMLLCLIVFRAILASAEPPAVESGTLPASARFDDAYATLMHADRARDDNEFFQAMDLYEQARTAYSMLAQEYPEWQPDIVAFRIAYCRDQLAVLKDRVGGLEAEMATDRATTPGPLDPGMSAAPRSSADLEIMLTAARDLLQTSRPAEARSYLLEALRQNPDHPDVRMLLGLAQCQAGDYRDARYVLETLVEETDSARARLLLATALLGLGRIQEAVEQMQGVLHRQPAMPEAHYNMAQLYLLLEEPDPEQARFHYLKSLEFGGAPDPELERRIDARPDVQPSYEDTPP